MLSDKALRIIKVLVLNKDTPVTVKMLSVMLDMSERTVNTYLKEVGSFCENHRITYVGKRGVGVYLEQSGGLKNMKSPFLENPARE